MSVSSYSSDGAEAVALLARAARRVEREELRRGRGRGGAVVRALEALGEAQPRDARLVERRGHRLGEENHRVAVALAKRGGERIGETSARRLRDDEPVDDDEQLLREGDVDVPRVEIVEVHDVTVEADADEALRAQVLDDDFVRHFARQLERRGDVEARARGQREHGVGDRLHRVGLDLAAADGAERVADARPEEAQVVVDLRGGADGGARRLGGVLLLDGDGGREPVDRDRRRASPCARETAARRRTATRRSGAGPRRRWCRRRATTCPSPTGR